MIKIVLTVFFVVSRNMGALGIIAPVQGGIGAWHFMTIQALVFYLGDGIASEAKAFALSVHSVQTILVYIGCGIIAYILLPIVNKKMNNYSIYSFLFHRAVAFG